MTTIFTEILKASHNNQTSIFAFTFKFKNIVCYNIIIYIINILLIDYFYIFTQGVQRNCGPLWHLSMCCIPSSIYRALVVHFIF